MTRGPTIRELERKVARLRRLLALDLAVLLLIVALVALVLLVDPLLGAR